MYDVICIGGGLAGLTAAIHLKKAGHSVLVLEKEKYPHHKVCGEYLSREVLPYLTQLGINLPTNIEIDTLEFSTIKGRTLKTSLPLGALGISRYTLDHTLYLQALSAGVRFEFCTAISVEFDGSAFSIGTNIERSFETPFVLGTYGKRSGIDKYLNRSFMESKSPWLGVKAHYQFDDFPDNLVGLHSFEGGYAGLSRTEDRAVNFCYLVSYESFKRIGNIEDFNRTVVAKNPYLRSFLDNSRMLFDKPLTISQISFASKNPVEAHMIMCGDTAGLIHPLCGNGMAMAIHSAKITAELLDIHLRKQRVNREVLEREYIQAWKKAFASRIRTGRYLQGLLLSPGITDLLFTFASRSPGILRKIISKTHGKTLAI